MFAALARAMDWVSSLPCLNPGNFNGHSHVRARSAALIYWFVRGPRYWVAFPVHNRDGCINAGAMRASGGTERGHDVSDARQPYWCCLLVDRPP